MFLDVKGREAQGIIEPSNFENERDELPPGLSDPSELDSNDSNVIAPFPFNNESIGRDLNHAWSVAHMAYDNGKMDGFVAAEKSGLTMGYYDRNDIPYYWNYTDDFVLDDNFFSSLMGPSFPNHPYIASGTNGPITNLTYPWIRHGGVIDNPGQFWEGMSQGLSLNWSTLAQEMSNVNMSWAWYDGKTNPLVPHIWNVLPLFTYLQNHPDQLSTHVKNARNLVTDIQNGQLLAVSWIILGDWVPPAYPAACKGTSGPSEHPPARSDCRMDYVAYLVNQVMKSQYWQSSAIVIT